MQSPPGNGDSKSDVCRVCGKQIGPTISGSITAWIFKESCCTCAERQDTLHGAPVETAASGAPVASTSATMGTSGAPVQEPVAQATPIGSILKRRAQMSEYNMQPMPQVAQQVLQSPPQAKPVVSNMPPGISSNFGERYEMMEMVGEGGMAKVYKVRDLVLNQFFAIKIIHPELAKDEVRQKRFEQEATTARALNHANIVTIYAFDISPEGVPYLIMDYVEGLNLGISMGDTPLELANFYDIFIQVCSALAHAHSRGVIHRDIKPSNILVTALSAKTSWVKLADFGIAKMIMPHDGVNDLTKTGDFLGSPYYVSPEQAQGDDVDARSDIYSLGCVMFHAITGRPPFVGNSPVKIIMQQISDPPPRLATLSGADLPVGMERIIHRCLEKRPEDRYQNVFDIRTDLQLVQQGKEPQMMRTTTKKELPANERKELIDLIDLHKEDAMLNTVFEGALTFDMRLNHVIEQIIELGIPGDTLLRLRCSNPDFTGLIVIRDGYKVLGAKIMKQPIHGYDAFRKMMSLADAEFHYQAILATDYRLPDLSLQLNLNYVLFLYPNIPESPSELLDQAAIRDLVFAVKSDDTTLSYPMNDTARSGGQERTADMAVHQFDVDDESKWVSAGQIAPEKPKSEYIEDVENVLNKYEQSRTAEVVKVPKEPIASTKTKQFIKKKNVLPFVALGAMALIFFGCLCYLIAQLTAPEKSAPKPVEQTEHAKPVEKEQAKKPEHPAKPSAKKQKKKKVRKRHD